MFHYALLRLLLVAQAMCFGLFVVGGMPAPRLLSFDIQAEQKDDVYFAQVAAGFLVGVPLTEYDFQTSLDAVKLTDRFRSVEGSLVPGVDGVIAKVQVDSWPVIKHIVWCGDAQSSAVKRHIRGLRVGMRPGNIRLVSWSRELQSRLIEAGYPDASVSWAREYDDKRLIVTVKTGMGVLLRKIDVVGDCAPYTADEIRKFTKLVPGRTLWTAIAQQEALRNLYRIMRSHKRYEARIDLKWDGSGTLCINIYPGPRVLLVVKGGGFDRLGKIKRLILLDSADYYSPELLYESDWRIVHYLQSQGYLDAQVWHRRSESVVKNDTSEAAVTYIYTIYLGERHYLNKIRFTGNAAFEETELQQSIIALKSQCMSPDFLDLLESRVKSFYLSHGYMDVSLRSQLEHKDDKNEITFKIKEGPQYLLKRLKLELPRGVFGDSWMFGKYLALIISDEPKCVRVSGTSRLYSGNRRHLNNVCGSLSINDAINDVVVVTFELSIPIPLVRVDLARVVNAVNQQCLSSTGVARSLAHLELESIDGVVDAHIKTSVQPIENMRRLVVTGLDRTRARAVFREIKPQTNLPLDNRWFNRVQTGLNDSNAFQRVDVRRLSDQSCTTPAHGADLPTLVKWRPGDLQLLLEESPPYVITSSLSYDKDQGYHIGLGLTQLNIGGMGRTIDYGIRAGNGFIKSPTLTKIFPAGAHDRSIDSLTVGYTDPWFAPGKLKRLPADRTRYRVEMAHIREQSEMLLYRRRVLNTLQWRVDPELIFIQLGHRWEYADSKPKYAISDSFHDNEFRDDSLYKYAISAPFLQVVRDARDSQFDPTSGIYSMARVEVVNQPLLSNKKNSFIKLEFKNQIFWSPGGNSNKNGVLSLGLCLGAIRPTGGQTDIPRPERFFAGGPFSFRGVKPDSLGPKVGDLPVDQNNVDTGDTGLGPDAPVGGQGLILVNAEYKFPLFSKWIWGETFVDFGQVYHRLHSAANTPISENGNKPRPGFRTAVGLGLIFKIVVPIKIECATDISQTLARKTHRDKKNSIQLLIYAGSRF